MTSALYKLRSFPVTTKMILDLPYDIREIILKELLVSPRPLEELPYIYHQQNKAAQRTMPTIPGLSGQVLRVCQLLREEGTHILYGDNVACIRLRVYNSQYPEVSILGSIPVLGKTWLNHRLQGTRIAGGTTTFADLQAASQSCPFCFHAPLKKMNRPGLGQQCC